MNKRIQELAREAGFGVRQDEVYTAKLEHLPITENMEKFAELIVRECRKVINHERSNYPTTEWDHGADWGHKNAIDVVVEHFGIE